MIQTHKSYCRVCHAYCAMEVDVQAGRVVAVRGDSSDPVYGGYTCEKGRALPEAMNAPDRITRSLRRTASGDFEEISTQQALDEIAERVGGIIAKHGAQAVASYNGTHAFQNSAALLVSKAWHAGIGSPSYYTSVTIDQPAKFIAPSRVGTWEAGPHGFEDADVSMMIGNNTVVSHYAPFGGLPPFNASKRLRDHQKRGLKVICVDPRVTETARRADLHLQIRPGEDPTLLAGILRVILEEDLQDHEFCERWVDGVERLRAAVAPFDLGYVSERSDVAAELVVEAARLFARGPRGTATAGTGHNMSMRPNLSEHLTIALNVLCGRYNREGERVPNPGLLGPATPRRAQALGPDPVFGKGPQLRTRGLGEIFEEMPCAALPDEMLTPGPGQVKALFTIGGNPVVAFPDQEKTLRALDGLDLLVSIDRKLSATARRADYVLAPRLGLEREDTLVLADSWYEQPYGHYTPAVAAAGPELIEEWEFYWELARRLDTPIALEGGELPLDRKPTKLEVLETMLGESRIPLSQIRDREGGSIFPEAECLVQPPDPEADERLNVAPPGIPEELQEVRSEELRVDAGYAADTKPFSHRLICRRLSHVYNSSGQELESLGKRGATNLAYMNESDVAELGLSSGDLVEIESATGQILGVVESTDEVKRAVISMAHAFGGGPELDGAVRTHGSSTNRLVDSASNFDPISGMARQSGIPVNVRPVSDG
jgi:anaerobic selenocysteine-containing dehydrogenase